MFILRSKSWIQISSRWKKEMDIRKLGKTFLFVESRRNKRFFSLWPREETVGGDVTRENNINRNGTKRNVVKQRDPEKRNTDERVAMRSIRKKRKGKSPTIETMSCPIAVIAIQRRRRCGRRSSLSSTMSPCPPPFTYIHPSSTYIYIYIRFILAPRATIERITDRVPRDTSPSPPRSRRVSHHGPRSCRKFQDGVECLGGEPHCG